MRYQLSGSKSPLLIAVLLPTLLIAWGAAPQPANPAAPEQTLAQIARERIQVAHEACKMASGMYQRGLIQSEVVFEWTRRQAQAHMDAPESKVERVAFLEGYVRQLKDNEELLANQLQAGRCTPLDALAGQYHRLEGEMWLAKAKEQ